MAQPSNTILARHQVITCDDGILGGSPVFTGTRVPLTTLFDYLAGGDSLDDFLEDFPGVSREQAVWLLHAAQEQIVPRSCDEQAPRHDAGAL
jgi:uncharacterized protein (DUF433 family)